MSSSVDRINKSNDINESNLQRPLAAPLHVGQGDVDDDNNNLVENSSGINNQIPLDRKILEIIGSIEDRTIRPGRLAAELGISIEDASKELSGLLAAVGGGHDGATFRFEYAVPDDKTSPLTMVFSFPPDFEKRALRNRRKDDMWRTAERITLIAVKILKIVTAFGLILSLLIISIAAILGLFAAIVALSRGNDGHRHRSLLIHQIRTIFYTIRQLLWFYALFGPTEESEDGTQQDPFLREVAYDLWLFFSVCCGNPASIFFWMRASQLRSRRNRLFRGWGTERTSDLDTNIPGVTLVRRGGQDTSLTTGQTTHRGLLSVAVEFLFGPTPFRPGPTSAEIWQLRAAVLVRKLTENQGTGVSFDTLAPFIDYPPSQHSSVEQLSARMTEQGLLIVAHFNGVPVKDQSFQEGQDQRSAMKNARFNFPELLSESAAVTHYEHIEEPDDGTWAALLYRNNESTARSRNSIPSYLKEERYRFSKLALKQLTHCLVLGGLNLIGVIWLAQSISPGGVLEIAPGGVGFLFHGLLPTLKFYAVLFFALPAGRLATIIVLNHFRTERNRRRASFVGRQIGS